ncbi:hypothetical protein BH11MYX2_BH11MYX2_33900 [soil metagenome]
MKQPLALLLVLAAGCTTGQEDIDTLDDTSELSSCLGTPLRTEKSLAVTDPTVLARFGFDRTLNQLLASANTIGHQTKTQLFQQWMSTFGTTDCTNPLVDPEHYGERCPRVESSLAGLDPFGSPSTLHFKPVGVFNRFDLAPSDGANCGEYRIIYAMQGVAGRGFLIFEGALPNPEPDRGIDACTPVAQFWAKRSSDRTAEQTASQLEKFFFTGGAVPNFGPVVDVHNYGLGFNGISFGGQIRTDMFFQLNDWNLREFTTARQCASISSSTDVTCQLVFHHVSVKNNPANELFQGTHALAGKFK